MSGSKKVVTILLSFDRAGDVSMKVLVANGTINIVTPNDHIDHYVAAFCEAAARMSESAEVKSVTPSTKRKAKS